MDITSDDVPLEPKDVEFLLPRDIFEELFFETPKENHNESNNGNVANGLEDGVTIQEAYSAHGPSTHVVPSDEIENVTNGLEDGITIQAANSAHAPSTHVILSDELFINNWNIENLTNGLEDGITIQAANFVPGPSTRVIPSDEALEKTEEHDLPVQQMYTWAQIVKGEYINFNEKLGVSEISNAHSMESLVNFEKSKEMGISLDVKAQQTGDERKRGEMNEQSGQNSVEIENIQK